MCTYIPVLARFMPLNRKHCGYNVTHVHRIITSKNAPVQTVYYRFQDLCTMSKTYYTSSGDAIRNPSAYFAACNRNSGRSSGGSSRSYRSGGSSSKGGGSRSSYRTGLYTSSGNPVRNASAYAAAGGRCYSSAGEAISHPTAYADAVEANIRQNTGSPKYLYHYTDKSSLSHIVDSGVIRASKGPGDCRLGEGVYATALPPRTSSEKLSKNNWGKPKTSKVYTRPCPHTTQSTPHSRAHAA